MVKIPDSLQFLDTKTHVLLELTTFQKKNPLESFAAIQTGTNNFAQSRLRNARLSDNNFTDTYVDLIQKGHLTLVSSEVLDYFQALRTTPWKDFPEGHLGFYTPINAAGVYSPDTSPRYNDWAPFSVIQLAMPLAAYAAGASAQEINYRFSKCQNPTNEKKDINRARYLNLINDDYTPTPRCDELFRHLCTHNAADLLHTIFGSLYNKFYQYNDNDSKTANLQIINELCDYVTKHIPFGEWGVILVQIKSWLPRMGYSEKIQKALVSRLKQKKEAIRA